MKYTFAYEGVKHVRTQAQGKERNEVVMKETPAFIYTPNYKYNKTTGREIGDLHTNTHWLVAVGENNGQ